MGIDGVASGVVGLKFGAEVTGVGNEGRVEVAAGFAIGGFATIGAGGIEGIAGFTVLAGAGSISMKVSPDLASFTSVSTLPSGFVVDFTTVTARSGCP